MATGILGSSSLRSCHLLLLHLSSVNHASLVPLGCAERIFRRPREEKGEEEKSSPRLATTSWARMGMDRRGRGRKMQCAGLSWRPPVTFSPALMRAAGEAGRQVQAGKRWEPAHCELAGEGWNRVIRTVGKTGPEGKPGIKAQISALNSHALTRLSPCVFTHINYSQALTLVLSTPPTPLELMKK